jgi:pimeloyl-ACP methyl ester carboxylesterase
MEQKFIIAKGIKIHYRQMGEGEPIVLLHASPRSGKMLENLGKMLAETFQVIIPDLPGYGFSEAIPKKVNNLYEVVPYLKAFLEALNIENLSIYGTATGAQLGIAYALTYPKEVKNLFLDNPAHFSEEEYEQISENYFIDLSPKSDGSHLVNLWNHVRDSMMYFPWYDRSDEAQFSKIVPSDAVIADTVQSYIAAGERYDELYRAAFLHERAEKIQQLSVPTVIFKWKASILLKYIDRLLAFELPENVKVVETEKDILERYKKMVEIICHPDEGGIWNNFKSK